MNEDAYTLDSGLLDVGDGHRIYYQRWGNPQATPIIDIHGGPGSCSKDKHKNIFDPSHHHVIFFDQRGCGKSEFEDPLKNNTTDHLAEDMEKLRNHLHISAWHVVGYSWGSALGLYYATRYPDKVKTLLLGGIYLGSRAENERLFNGGLRQFAPEAWDWYTEPVPKTQQKDCLKFYAENLLDTDKPDDEKLELLKHYATIESSLVSKDSDFVTTKIDALNAKVEDITGHQIGLTYFTNNCFMPDDYYDQALSKIAHIPCIIVQGSMDFVCPPETAYKVARLLGESCHTHFVPTSHAREGAMRETLRAYAWSLLR